MIMVVIKMNFPTRKKEQTKIINKANLGMDLEAAINDSNTYYLNNDIAVIHKKPTPVQIVKVNYPSRNKAVITEAYYKTPSTTDYNGLYKGKYI
ncbi:MAG: Holliday junction resolvase RecU, partial [Anaeroplasmataceae bacterium]|nr:Holliday junction resolvase RecU [Anaeroplasmataceae bacterium]